MEHAKSVYTEVVPVNLDHFQKNWDSIQWENKIWRLLAVGLTAAVVILAYAVIHADKIIVLSPPNLSEEVEISRQKASLAYKKGFAMYLATLGGNVTPGNGKIIKEAVGPLLSPGIYRQVMDNIEAQINALKLDRITLEYTPKSITYEKETEKIFVSGIQTSRGPSGQPDVKRRTYEFIIEIQNYRPILVHAAAYSGNPKTLAALKSKEDHSWKD